MMLALGSSFAGRRYVSDVLEDLLDARLTRRAVREYCAGLLRDVAQPLRTRLEPVAEYVGGKCMGYPAIWFLQALLSQSPYEIIKRCRSALCLSLSTSIVDDLADRDEAIGEEFLAYLYVLIGEAVFAGGSDVPMRAQLHHALEVCLNPQAVLRADAAVRRGDRIGAFFAMIAAKAVDAQLDEARAALAVEATARFGEICAHIDDWMDAERDLERGVVENVALALLRERVTQGTLRRADLALHRAWLENRMHALLEERIDHTLSLLHSGGFEAASQEMHALRRRCQDSPLRM